VIRTALPLRLAQPDTHDPDATDNYQGPQIDAEMWLALRELLRKPEWEASTSCAMGVRILAQGVDGRSRSLSALVQRATNAASSRAWSVHSAPCRWTLAMGACKRRRGSAG